MINISWKLFKKREERRFRRERAKKGYCIRDLWAMDTKKQLNCL